MVHCVGSVLSTDVKIKVENNVSNLGPSSEWNGLMFDFSKDSLNN